MTVGSRILGARAKDAHRPIRGLYRAMDKPHRLRRRQGIVAAADKEQRDLDLAQVPPITETAVGGDKLTLLDHTEQMVQYAGIDRGQGLLQPLGFDLLRDVFRI